MREFIIIAIELQVLCLYVCFCGYDRAQSEQQLYMVREQLHNYRNKLVSNQCDISDISERLVK